MQVAGEACDRFFSIDELVTLLLHQAPTRVLINCQVVCTLWNTIITRSPVLQKKLFLLPSTRPWEDEEEDYGADSESSETSESSPAATGRKAVQNVSNKKDTPTLNPVLAEMFAPILASHDLGSSTWCDYSQLSSLPWAKTGTQLDSRSREAFARQEASWRSMLVSQPPIYRLDWWHEWTTTDNHRSGWGHQDYGRPGNQDVPITLGMLWDLVESRLLRGCSAQILYFPEGKAPADDAMAIVEEKEWASGGHGQQHHGFTPEMPRIKLMTRQIWNQVPRGVKFNHGTRRWQSAARVRGYFRRHHEGDGFNVLRQDCNGDCAVERWSRSEGFRWAEIHGESSSGGHEDPSGTRRW
ncbi:hypothetical protein LTR85_009735 [Meristemomyces frigidus]|nr:hypothetical protein LTR85_009735 [Meristemomyces frigidus]